jgi:tagatose 6-phosphate kinase
VPRRDVHVTASGKAVNVARVASTLGAPVCLVHLLGGDTGRWIERTLDGEGVSQQIVWAHDDAPTRTCSTLLAEDGPTTELVEEARPVTASDVDALEAAVLRHLPDARALCLSGSLPPGMPPQIYARLAEAARQAGVPVLVDTQRAPIVGCPCCSPLLVKPNRDEAHATLGLSPTGDTKQTRAGRGRVAGGRARSGRSYRLARPVAPWLPRRRPRWRIASPRVNVVNPIGSGDSLAAGLLVAHVVPAKAFPDAVAYGTAAPRPTA